MLSQHVPNIFNVLSLYRFINSIVHSFFQNPDYLKFISMRSYFIVMQDDIHNFYYSC